MRWNMPFLLAQIVLCLWAPAGAQELTIPELVARGAGNPIYIPRIREINYVPIDELLTQLLDGSSLIVEGTLKPVRSYLSVDKRWIYTDYALDARQVLFNRHPSVSSVPGVQQGIIIRVFGGTLTVDGVTVTVVDENMAYCKPGAQVVLFLKPSTAQPGSYELAGDFIGAFGITPSGVEPLVRPADLLKEVRGMSRNGFVDRVRQEIARRPK
jgi:hypothetical protein